MDAKSFTLNDVQSIGLKKDDKGSKTRGLDRGGGPRKQNYTSANFLQGILLARACGTTKESLQLRLRVSWGYSVQRRTSKCGKDRETEVVRAP